MPTHIGFVWWDSHQRKKKKRKETLYNKQVIPEAEIATIFPLLYNCKSFSSSIQHCWIIQPCFASLDDWRILILVDKITKWCKHLLIMQIHIHPKLWRFEDNNQNYIMDLFILYFQFAPRKMSLFSFRDYR